MLKGFGIKNAADFDNLGNDAKLGFLNILGEMAGAGLSLTGWKVAREGYKLTGKLRIDQERTFFTPKNPGVYDALKTAVSKSKFNPQNHWKHKNVDTSFRQNRDKKSLQIGFGTENGKNFMEIDIDPFNPHRLLLEHFFADVARNKIAGAFGGVGKTDPYRVANRKYWECKPQKGGKK